MVVALVLAASAGCTSQPTIGQRCFAEALRDCHAAWSAAEGRNNRELLIRGADRFGYCHAAAKHRCAAALGAGAARTAR
jgi:hypothetical protein